MRCVGCVCRMKLTWMRNAGNIDGKCNVGSSFIKAVMPGVWLTRRIMYCHHMQPNFAEFGLEKLLTLNRSTIMALTFGLFDVCFCSLQDCRQS